MKSKEKTEQILNRYKQYLRFEKSLSAHTLDAYLRDLDKLCQFLKDEGIDLLEVSLEHLETFTAGLRDAGICPVRRPASSPASVPFTATLYWKTIWKPTLASCWNRPKQASICPKCSPWKKLTI